MIKEKGKGGGVVQQVRCYECGKRYDYDEDAFCPKCGAFNQPPRKTCVSADGTVVRADGLNERNHTDSFVHQELHAEKRQRRKVGLDKSVERISRPAAAPKAKGKPAEKVPLGKIILWVIFAITIFNLFSGFLYLLL